MTPTMHRFDRSGLASLDDLETQEWKDLFAAAERSQQAFLSRESEFRGSDYPWPRDAVHGWSRIWEYPYVLHHLRAWRAARGLEAGAQVMDFGCGVTFFPFLLAQEGFRVTAVDIDPVVERDFTRAIRVTPCAPGSVEFLLSAGGTLSVQDGAFDAVYSVSVLEHVGDFGPTVDELARVLAPRGRLILTVDLCIEGAGDIKAECYDDLVRRLEERFDWTAPERTVHPARVLDTESSPCPYRSSVGRTRRLVRLARRAVKEWLGMRLSPPLNRWQCMGMVFDKKA